MPQNSAGLGIVESTGARLLIFDLDNCLFDTRKMGERFIDPVLAVLRGAASLSEERKHAIEMAMRSQDLSAVVERFKVPEVIALGMRAAYAQLETPEGDFSFGDEENLLRIEVSKILVTSGFRRLQRSKMLRLGINRCFDEVIVDPEDRPEIRRGKTRIFSNIRVRSGLPAREIMVVGDSGPSELMAGKTLGMVTVQTLRSRVERWVEADFHILSLADL
jgi:putative hydrolase of the HAD superfamily